MLHQQHSNDSPNNTTTSNHLLSRRLQQVIASEQNVSVDKFIPPTNGDIGNHSNDNHHQTTRLTRIDSKDRDADDDEDDDVVAALHRRIKIATANNNGNFGNVNKKKNTANGGFNIRCLLPQTAAAQRQNHQRHHQNSQQQVAKSDQHRHPNNSSFTHKTDVANAVAVAADVVVDDVDMLEEAVDDDAVHSLPASSSHPPLNNSNVPNAAVFQCCDNSDIGPNSISIHAASAGVAVDAQPSSSPSKATDATRQNDEASSSPSKPQQQCFAESTDQQQRYHENLPSSPLLLSTLSVNPPPTFPPVNNTANSRLPTNSRVQTDFDVLMPNGTFTTVTTNDKQRSQQSVKQYIRHFNGKAAAELATTSTSQKPAHTTTLQTQQQILQSGLTSILLGTYNNVMQQSQNPSSKQHLSYANNSSNNNNNQMHCDPSSSATFLASVSNHNFLLQQQQKPSFSSDNDNKMLVDDGNGQQQHNDQEENGDDDDGIDDDYDDQEEEYDTSLVTTTVEAVFNSASAADPAAAQQSNAIDDENQADVADINADEEAAEEEESRHSVEPPDDDHGGEMRVDPEVVVIEDDEELPWGWQKRMSRTSGKPYYLNLFSKKSQWHAPSTPGWISPTHHENDWPKVRVAHVLIRHKDSRRPMTWRGDVVGRSLEEAIQLAWSYRDMIALQQLSFEDAAGQFSDCGSARQAGEIGWITKGHMHRAFEEQAFALGVGDVCEAPVLTKTGVHIIKRIG